VLHVQTEDSGRERPHIITHLYHEGAILATKRTSYADLVRREDLPDRVRALMKTQHRAMMIELKDGAHDAVIEKVTGPLPGRVPAAGLPAPAGGSPSAVAAPPAADVDVEQSEAFLAALRELAGAEEEVAAASAPGSSPPESDAFLAALRELAGAGARETDGGPEAEPPLRPSSVPPAPVAPRATPAAVQHRPSYRPPMHPQQQDQVAVPRPVAVAPDVPAPARARAEDATTPSREREGFGRDLISDRSLDDVILSYLAEELTRKDDE
jgi:hypothetical protein